RHVRSGGRGGRMAHRARPVGPGAVRPGSTMSAPSTTGGVHTVRRLVLYSLLLTLVIVAAAGLSGLLWRLFDAGRQLAGDDSAGLAQSLAFTLVAGPLAVLLWWFIWRSLSTQGDRRSVLWGVYLLITTVVAPV